MCSTAKRSSLVGFRWFFSHRMIVRRPTNSFFASCDWVNPPALRLVLRSDAKVIFEGVPARRFSSNCKMESGCRFVLCPLAPVPYSVGMTSTASILNQEIARRESLPPFVSTRNLPVAFLEVKEGIARVCCYHGKDRAEQLANSKEATDLASALGLRTTHGMCVCCRDREYAAAGIAVPVSA